MNHPFIVFAPRCALTLSTGVFVIATAGCSEPCALGFYGYQCNGDLLCDVSDMRCMPPGSLGIGGDCSGSIELCAGGLYCEVDLTSDGGANFTCQPQIGPDAACPFNPTESCVTGYMCSGPAQAVTGTCIPNTNGSVVPADASPIGWD